MFKFSFLSKEFYQEYVSCSEIEQKPMRPYIQIEIEIDGVLFAVPLRSNINHPHVLWTDKENHCGADLSKTVVILDPDKYIDQVKKPYLRKKEFDNLRGKEHILKRKLQKYISDYKSAKKDLKIPRNKQLVEYSTLQYFEEYI